MPLYGQSSGSPPRFIHRRRPAAKNRRGPCVAAPGRRPDWATFSPVFCGSSSSIFCGDGGAFFRAFVSAATAPIGSL
jgi:hypothetical protein